MFTYIYPMFTYIYSRIYPMFTYIYQLFTPCLSHVYLYFPRVYSIFTPFLTYVFKAELELGHLDAMDHVSSAKLRAVTSRLEVCHDACVTLTETADKLFSELTFDLYK